MQKKVITPFLIALVFAILIFVLPQRPTTLFSPEEPTIPQTCADADISTTWEDIFQTSSTGITIKTQSTQTPCPDYVAFKTENQIVYYIHGTHSTETTEIKANYMEYDQTYFTDELTPILTGGTTTEIISELENPSSLTERTLELPTAITHWTNTFQFVPQNWEIETKDEVSHFVSETETSNATTTQTILIDVNGEETLSELEYTRTYTPETCAPNWTAHNTSCTSGDTLTTYYTPDIECGATPPANETADCDYDDNGIIGTIGSIDEHNLDEIEIDIDGEELESEVDYTIGEEKEIEIYSEGKKIVKFDWDFSDEPLNLRKIELRKQSSSGEYGYLIVNGIDAEKTIRVDRISNKTRVCVEEREISSISAISDDCDGSREELISCPGDSEDEDIECDLHSRYFEISGLEHSGAMEYGVISTPVSSYNRSRTCVPSWTYSNWSACINGIQTRTATDSNNCGTLTNRGALSRSCGTACTPDWDCDDWTPATCPKNEKQTRKCEDLNNCQADKTETRDCEYKKSNTLLIALIAIAAVIILAIILVIIHSLRNRGGNEPSPYSPGTSWPPPKPPMMQTPPRGPPAQPRMPAPYRR